jgi:putative heme transporter
MEDRSADEAAAAAPATPQRRRVRLGTGSALLIAVSLLVTLVLRNVIVEAHRVIGWAIACTVVAVLVAPLVERISHVVPRPVALVLTGVTIAALAGVLVYGLFDDLRSETARLRIDGVAAAERLEQREDRLGEVARDVGLTQRASDFFAAIDERVGSGGDALRSAAFEVPTYFVTWILTMFLLLHGARMVNGGLRVLEPPARRERWTDVLAHAVPAARGYTFASIVQGVVVASLTAAFVQMLDLPAPVLLSLIVGLASMIPYIGIVIGAVPVVLLAAGIESARWGIFVIVAALGLQIVEAFVVRRRVDAITLHVGPAVPVFVAALGFEVYGLGGALYGVVIAVFVLAVADAAATPDERDLPTPTEDRDGGLAGRGTVS